MKKFLAKVSKGLTPRRKSSTNSAQPVTDDRADGVTAADTAPSGQTQPPPSHPGQHSNLPVGQVIGQYPIQPSYPSQPANNTFRPNPRANGQPVQPLNQNVGYIDDAQALAYMQARAEEEEQLQLAMAMSLSAAENQGSTPPGTVPRPQQNGSACPARQPTPASAPVSGNGTTQNRTAVPQQYVAFCNQTPNQTTVPAQQEDQDPTKIAEGEALNSLNTTVALCLETNSVFVDPTFMPGPKILYTNGKCRRDEAQELLVVQHYQKHGQDIQWSRPQGILQRPDDLQMEFESQEDMITTMHQFSRMVEWRVFQSDPRPADISQGALGNCWFCGSLAALAEKPCLVKRLFVDDYSKRGDSSPVGAYLVRLCDGGRWQYALLDDMFPCNQVKMLAFSGARRNQLWVPLIEKAYAKIRGCYEALEGGSPAEGLRLLSGWPSIVQELQPREQDRAPQEGNENIMRVQSVCPFEDFDDVWMRLVSAHSVGLIMCGSCGHVDGITKEMYRGTGLSPSHCYSIVKVASAREGTLRLLKVRNPWGTGLKWKGKWNDSDTDWTAELKNEVGANDIGEEGVFWMSLEDIKKYFTSITICPFREDWHEYRRAGTFSPIVTSGSQPGYIVHASGVSELLLSLMQPQEERISTNQWSADMGMVMFRILEGGDSSGTIDRIDKLEYVDCTPRKVHDTVVCNHMLGRPGEKDPKLLVVPMSFNQRTGDSFSPSKDFTFACFSSTPVKVRSATLSAKVVHHALVSSIRNTGTFSELMGGVRVHKSSNAGLTVMVENPTGECIMFESSLTDVFNITISRGIQVNEQCDQFLKTRDTIPPMHGMIVFVAAAMPSGHRYSFTSHFNICQQYGDVHTPPLAEPDALHSPFFLEGFSAPRGQVAAFSGQGLRQQQMMGQYPRGYQGHGRTGRNGEEPGCQQQ